MIGDSNKPSLSPPDSLRLHDHADVISDVLFWSIGEGAIVIDERGHIVRANQVALDILGYAAEDIIGKWYPETIVSEDHDGNPIPNIDRPITEVFFTGKPIFRKVQYRRSDDSRVPVALTVSPVMLGGKPIGAIELFRDITEELQLEHAKDEFISIASHQLRTPATVVKQYLGMVLDGYAVSDEEQTRMIRTAYEHNNNELDIINDLLKVAQLESSKLTISHKQINIVEQIQNIVSSLKPEFTKRNIELLFNCQKSTIAVCADPLHIQMVLENLISNANKYSNPGSAVTIQALESPKKVTIQVSDQGIGIAEDDIAKLFNKFSRIKNPNSTAGGTGLGLYWAKKLVELYDGSISVTSVINKGSTFTVVLPRGGRS